MAHQDEPSEVEDPSQIEGTIASFPVDTRGPEIVSLIDACRSDESAKAPFRTALSEASFLDGLAPRVERQERAQAIEDAAAVIVAFDAVSKLTSEATQTNASVRAVLVSVLEQATKIEVAEEAIRRTLQADAGSRARMMIEDAALKSALRRVFPTPPIRRPFQHPTEAAVVAGKVNASVSRGLRMRGGKDLLRRALKRQSPRISLLDGIEFARRHGLSTDQALTALDLARRIPELIWGDDASDRLVDAVRSAVSLIDSSSSGPSTHVLPPPNLVLAFGALELLCAWAPTRRPTTTEDGAIAILVEGLRNSHSFEQEGRRQPREAIIAVVDGWKVGRGARLFDGRDPTREVRRQTQRNFEADRLFGGERTEEPVAWYPRNRGSSRQGTE